MHIDKSFQLLSADSGKAATDETRRQSAGDDDAEFSELLGAELNQKEQKKEAEKAAGTDKAAGQEVAALLTKQAKSTEQLNAEKSLAEKVKDAVTGANEATQASSQTDQTVAANGEILDVNSGAAGSAAKQTAADIDPDTLTDLEADPTENSNPWLLIISQSHDFNEILSQSSQQTTTTANDAAFSPTEALVADLLGVPVTDKEAMATEPVDAIAGQVAQAMHSSDASPKGDLLDAGKEMSGPGDNATTLSDTTLLNIAEGKQDAAAKIAAEDSTLAIKDGHSDNTVNATSTKLPAEQMTVRELAKVDQPHQQMQVGGISEPDVTASNNAIAKQSATDGSAATADTAVRQATQLQINAEAVAAQLNQTNDKAAKNSATTPVDLQLPIEENPDGKTLSALVNESATPVRPAKNAPQSFAQFQKTANAAAALVHKQQMQSDQLQGQPIQDLAVQQTQRVAEFNPSLAGTHTETPITLTTLLQTERPISAGSAMGSSTGQQQQQAASQLFAARLNDQVNSSEQPALQLLEPNAATQLKERVMFQVNQKIQSAEIKLAPEELGSMQIKVQMQQEQLSVQFVVQQAGAKEALEQQMPRLREMLEEQGMQLTDGQVSQQREGTDDQKQARQRNQAFGQGADIDDEPLQQQAMVRVSDRMVDYYA